MKGYKVIGISGKAGSGKDYLYSNHLKPLGFFQISLAWHFKADLIGKGVLTFEEAFVTKPPKVRTMLQLIGTELGRDVYGDGIWCNTLEAWMDVFNHHWGVNKFVIPDVRFVNEIEFVESFEGMLLRIKAPERTGETNLDKTQRAHPSEVEMDGVPDSRFTAIIHNDPGDDLGLQLNRVFTEAGWIEKK